MNIYLSVELAVRELDSKILLATLAAARGHQVIVSEQNIIKRSLKSGVLDPGIFHAKSLTPNNNKIALHQSLIDHGFKITSIDEEANLIDHGYEMFARNRYSEKMMELTSTVFGWGIEDVETLKKYYPKYSSKIHQTGSPRADLWKSFFSDYWGVPSMAPKKPYLLVSSNMEAYRIQPFHDIVRFHKDAGYYQRDPNLLKKQLGTASESYTLTAAFIEAIKYLAKKNNSYDIVLRPHPTENIEPWKISLENIPNVHVVREGSITSWVNNAFAVMHNGCVTALEATFSGKPVLTYVPFKQDFARKLPNELGHRIETLDELLLKVNTLFDSSKILDHKDVNNVLPEIISKKIHFDNNELAAEKMIKLWENLDDGSLSQTSKTKKFQLFLKVAKIRSKIGTLLRKFNLGKFGSTKEDWKFPPLDQDDIRERVNRLKHVLKIDVELECKLVSDQTILIRRS
jgi:surface carbohydrate biosynthesis protein